MAEQLIVQEAFVTFARLDKPVVGKFSPEAQFSITVFISPEDAVKAVALLEKQYDAFTPQEKLQINKALWLPRADAVGDKHAPASWHRITRYSTSAFPCVDAQGRAYPSLEAMGKDIYSGCYVSLALHAYSTKKKPGVGLEIDGIKKLRDGERLVSMVSANPFLSTGANPFTAAAPAAPVAPVAAAPVAPVVAAPVAQATVKPSITAEQFAQMIAAGIPNDQILSMYNVA